ncbi:MAG: glycosyltransferase family 4 protein [Anaerolineae bacterium]|nr:glycosyltransferase family 4 protein [Gloeobacterales cyanobacterium ES-bin-313]
METISLRVFYLWNRGATEGHDPGFQQNIQWDVPLLEGYDHEFVDNSSNDPGTHHFWGIYNPNLIEQVQNWKPDTVLLLAYNYASIYLFLYQWRHRTPVIFRGDSHRLGISSNWRNRLKRLLISTVFHQFDICLYVGSANKEYFLEHGLLPRQLFFCPHSVDNKRFFEASDRAIEDALVWRKSLGIPTGDSVILYAGKFEQKKRPTDLLEAFLQLNWPEASLLLVGAGLLEETLKTQANGHPKVFFAPFQNQSFMPRIYAAGDLFVLPSGGGYETWGLAVNEAMCMSRPIIVSDQVGCAADLVEPNENGLIFPAGDVDALAQCLQEALCDPHRLKQWGNLSRQRIHSYSYEQASAGLLKALSSISSHF